MANDEAWPPPALVLPALRGLIESNIRTMAAALKQLGMSLEICGNRTNGEMCIMRHFSDDDIVYSPAEVAEKLAAVIITFGEPNNVD